MGGIVIEDTKTYLISKYHEPTGAYAASLEQLPGEEENLTPRTDGVIMKKRAMTPEQAVMVLERDHIESVTPNREVQAFATDFDEQARAYHQIVQANKTGADGLGQTIAVLDTGVKEETIRNAPLKVRAMRSFIQGQPVEDSVSGHGDFCCVAATPPAADLLVGKVLSDQGSGWDSGIIAGIDWAISQGADCISMSLGSDTTDTSAYDPILRRCMELGVIVFAAAGNAGNNRPVGTPGRSRYCYAVAAFDDRNDRIAGFSCTGPEIDYAGSGVDVFYRGRGWNGTSMATPLVACAFLTILGEVKPGTRQERAQIALKAMNATCRNLPAPPEHDGMGVPQAAAAIAKIPPVPAPAPPAPAPPDSPPMEKEILALINEHRRSKGMKDLSDNQLVHGESKKHSEDMAAGRVPYGHGGFNERAGRLNSALKGNAAAENVAQGYTSARAVVAGWLGSSGHRANIEGNYNLTGIGVAVSPNGTRYFTQIFLSAAEATPAPAPKPEPAPAPKPPEGEYHPKLPRVGLRTLHEKRGELLHQESVIWTGYWENRDEIGRLVPKAMDK